MHWPHNKTINKSLRSKNLGSNILEPTIGNKRCQSRETNYPIDKDTQKLE